MLETMYAAPGRGLAAPQVGVSKRLFVMDTTWKEGAKAPRVLINPEIIEVSSDEEINAEGCLSLPDFTVEVKRPSAVTMTWQDIDGQRHIAAFAGFDAICAQHELDHLDGILTIDRIAADARADVAHFLTALKAPI